MVDILAQYDVPLSSSLPFKHEANPLERSPFGEALNWTENWIGST